MPKKMHCDNEKCGCQNLTRKVPAESVKELKHRISEYERLYDAQYEKWLDGAMAQDAEIFRLRRGKWFQRTLGSAIMVGIVLHYVNIGQLILTVALSYGAWFLFQQAYDKFFDRR